MLDLVFQAFVTFFVIIDPIGLAVIFTSLALGLDAPGRRRAARRGTVIAGAVLFVFAFGGDYLLRALGIGLPAFRIAGGVLLLLLAIDMVMARSSGLRATTHREDLETYQREDISVFPLAIPLIAGPGAMTSVVLLMGRTEGDPALQAAILLVLAAVLVLTLAMLFLADRVMDLLGVTGANVVSRVLGIVLAALAVQFILDGLTAGLGLEGLT